jgi:hypothetical protein
VAFEVRPGLIEPVTFGFKDILVPPLFNTFIHLQKSRLIKASSSQIEDVTNFKTISSQIRYINSNRTILADLMPIM